MLMCVCIAWADAFAEATIAKSRGVNCSRGRMVRLRLSKWRTLVSITVFVLSGNVCPAQPSPSAAVNTVAGLEMTESTRLVRIGNSSVWIPKGMYDDLMNKGSLPNGMFVTLRGPITNNEVEVLGKLLAPYLDATYLKSNPKPNWYKADQTDVGYWLTLDSEGGDVYAALRIGRMLRKARAWTHVLKGSKCISACVFLLAGSVRRDVDGGVVGIHRPYSSDTEALSFEEMQVSMDINLDGIGC